MLKDLLNEMSMVCSTVLFCHVVEATRFSITDLRASAFCLMCGIVDQLDAISTGCGGTVTFCVFCSCVYELLWLVLMGW